MAHFGVPGEPSGDPWDRPFGEYRAVAGSARAVGEEAWLPALRSTVTPLAAGGLILTPDLLPYPGAPAAGSASFSPPPLHPRASATGGGASRPPASVGTAAAAGAPTPLPPLQVRAYAHAAPAGAPPAHTASAGVAAQELLRTSGARWLHKDLILLLLRALEAARLTAEGLPAAAAAPAPGDATGKGDGGFTAAPGAVGATTAPLAAAAAAFADTDASIVPASAVAAAARALVVSPVVAQRPESGSLLVYDKRRTPLWRRDGYQWKGRGDRQEK